MTSFEDRERAFEAQFTRDAEMAFRVAARRNRLLGQWAAERMQLTPAEADAYATSVVQADFEQSGDADVVRKIVGDMAASGLDLDDAVVRRALDEASVEARRQLMEAY